MFSLLMLPHFQWEEKKVRLLVELEEKSQEREKEGLLLLPLKGYVEEEEEVKDVIVEAM